MEALLIGAAIYLLTEGTKYLQTKFKKQISMRLVVAVLCLIAGTVYYVLQQNNPEVLTKLITFVSGAFATSQGMWMVVDKIIGQKLPQVTPPTATQDPAPAVETPAV
jgi:hypothetical protein